MGNENPSKRKRRYYLKAHGVAFSMDAAPVMAHVQRLYAAGMSLAHIAEASGASESSVSNYLNGYRREHDVEVPITTMHARVGRALLAVRPEPPRPRKGAVNNTRYGAHIDPTGTQRRVQALMAIGFSASVIGQEMGSAPQVVTRIVKRHFTFVSTKERVDLVYEKLNCADPLDYGMLPGTVRYCKRQAARKGYAPSHCWDSDTIDDPDALPQWTGECGTVTGFRIHRRDGIPVCDACRVEWNADVSARRRGYTRDRRTHIRELADQGWTPEEIAEELGIHVRTVFRGLE